MTTTVDDYIAAQPEPARATLEQLRADIRATAPDATEVISYGVPTFRMRKGLVGYGAAKAHVGFYVMSPAAIEAHADRLEGYGVSKGVIRIEPGETFPAELVRSIVEARLAEDGY